MKKTVAFFPCYLLVFLLFSYCKDIDFENPCDINSKVNLYSNLMNSISGNKNVFCTKGSTTTGSKFEYPKSDFVFYTEINQNISPTIQGKFTDCKTDVALPTGLTLDRSNCIISGIPISPQPKTLYEIQASEGSQSKSVSISIRVSGTTAIAVYGQFNSFTCAIPNNNGSCGAGSVSANNLNTPIGIAADSDGNLFVADFSHSRVLAFPKDNIIPNQVWGQNGSYTTSASGTTASALNGPTGVATDSNGNLYVADTTNNRALFFPKGSISPTRIYGQFGDYTCNVVNNNGSCVGGAISTDSLNGPNAIAVDSKGKVYISDGGNNRVLVYPNNGSTTAIAVYGQFGSFSCGVQNQSGICSLGPPPSANNLNYPNGLALDNNDNLYIMDTGNHRVLYYPSGSTTATKVFGQADSFTCGLPNNDGNCVTTSPKSSNMSNPQGLAVDSSNNLFVADFANNRILFYDPTSSTSASRVYGHNKNFNCQVNDDNGSCITGAKSAIGLNGPQKVITDTNGNVFISDSNNHRILKY